MGLSPRNLWDMKRFYERYRLADIKLRRSVAVLPWRHNILLLNKVQSLSAVEFYANEVITKGWQDNSVFKTKAKIPTFALFLIFTQTQI